MQEDQMNLILMNIELQRSLERLRIFVASFPDNHTRCLHICVEEYCDKVAQYRINGGNMVIEIA